MKPNEHGTFGTSQQNSDLGVVATQTTSNITTVTNIKHNDCSMYRPLDRHDQISPGEEIPVAGGKKDYSTASITRASTPSGAQSRIVCAEYGMEAGDSPSFGKALPTTSGSLSSLNVGSPIAPTSFQSNFREEPPHNCFNQIGSQPTVDGSSPISTSIIRNENKQNSFNPLGLQPTVDYSSTTSTKVCMAGDPDAVIDSRQSNTTICPYPSDASTAPITNYASSIRSMQMCSFDLPTIAGDQAQDSSCPSSVTTREAIIPLSQRDSVASDKIFVNAQQLDPVPSVQDRNPELGTALSMPSLQNKLKGLCSSRVVIDELLTLPDPRLLGSVPNYFEGETLSEEKLPAFLKGMKFDLSNSHLDRDQANKLIHYCCILPPGRDTLFSPTNSPGCATNFKVLVDIADTSPWQARLTPCSPSDKDEIGKLLDKYLDQDVIEPCHGPYSCSVLLVRKSNGRHKIACCLNTLNARSRKNSYPLPLMQENLGQLSGKPYLSAIDVCGGYLNMIIEPADRDYFGFITAFGLFRWKRVPYGWRNAGANFCFLMDKILGGLRYQTVASYVDDIAIFGGRDFDEHIMCIRLTLDRLQTHQLTLSISKCFFCAKSFEYLGFQISRAGVQPNHRNVEKITQTQLKSLADVRQFLGLCQFYRKWIPLFSQIVAPLYAALKAKWPERDQDSLARALKIIKDKLSTYPVLRHPDFNQEFFLATDGSLEGFGAILQQKCSDTGGLFAISYASCKLPASMKSLVGPQIEAAAACWSMAHFRHDLIGRKFTLLTDCEVMKYMKKTADPPRSIAASVLESMEFDYAVVHVPGPRHLAPDFMSRVAARQSQDDELTRKRQERVYMATTTNTRSQAYLSIRQTGVLLSLQDTPPIPGNDYILGREDWDSGQSTDTHIMSLRHALLGESKIHLDGRNVISPCTK